jgi:hypothetical protein
MRSIKSKCFFNFSPHADHEYDTITHFFLTSDLEWYPIVFDNDILYPRDEGSEFLVKTAFDSYGTICQTQYENQLYFVFSKYEHNINRIIDPFVLVVQSTHLDMIKANAVDCTREIPTLLSYVHSLVVCQ